MKIAAETKTPHRLTRVGSMLTLFFTDQDVVDWTTAARSDTKRYAGPVLVAERSGRVHALQSVRGALRIGRSQRRRYRGYASRGADSAARIKRFTATRLRRVPDAEERREYTELYPQISQMDAD